jgi:hypothetical protein
VGGYCRDAGQSTKAPDYISEAGFNIGTSDWDPVEATVDYFYIYVLPNTRY